MQLDMLNEEIQRNIDVASAKRRNRIEAFQQQVKDRNALEYQTWAQRAVALEKEAKKRDQFDRLKRLTVSIERYSYA